MFRRLARRLLWPATRALQCLCDPFVIFIPGAAALAGRFGSAADNEQFCCPARLARGLVLVLHGIEGPSLYSRSIRRGLACLPGSVLMCNWSGIWPAGLAVFSKVHRRCCIAGLIETIRAYRVRHPGRPVVMVGHSAGAAISIATAEQLGPAEPLDGIVALATPLHPRYDLSAALAGTRRMLACHSRGDGQLRMLTRTLGNFDRTFVSPAGWGGFESRHDRLVQLAWDRSMARYNHTGGHVGCTAARWVRRFIAPEVRQWITEKTCG